ncbi:MAG: hypothetical protein AAFV53_43630 [Myxococcota bacterium]
MDRDDNHRIQNHTGRPVEGHDFFGRERFIAMMLEDVQTANLLLLAPRRVGKTSVLKKIRVKARANGRLVAFTDVSDVVDELGFIEALLDAVVRERGPGVLERLKASPLGDALKHVKEVGAGPIRFSLASKDTGWRTLGEQLAASLLDLERLLIVAIDELPVMILELLKRPDGETRVRQFLNWFRKVRLSQQNVRWILSGSIGLDTVTQIHNLQSTINDLTIVSLEAFDVETADRFLARLGWSYDVQMPQPVRDAIIERLGWPLPYFLQLVFYELRRQNQAPDLDAVDAALTTLVAHRRHYFENWHQRLEEQLGDVRAGHAAVLLSACANAQGASRDTLIQALHAQIPETSARRKALDFTLWVLANDGYLVEVGSRFLFRSPLLRDWWRRYHHG